MKKKRPKRKGPTPPRRPPHPDRPYGSPAQDDLPQDEGLWVRSDVDPVTGAYLVTVSLDADHIVALDRAQALGYAVTAVGAAQRAEYDAAVFALLTRRLELDEDDAAKVVGYDLRPDRPPLDDLPAPWSFVPGMTVAGKPFLAIMLAAEQVGQVDVAELREHAMTVLEAPFAADLDGGFLRWLLSTGIDDNRARQAVADIANWRGQWPTS